MQAKKLFVETKLSALLKFPGKLIDEQKLKHLWPCLFSVAMCHLQNCGETAMQIIFSPQSTTLLGMWSGIV